MEQERYRVLQSMNAQSIRHGAWWCSLPESSSVSQRERQAIPPIDTRPDMRSVRESCHLPSQSRRCVQAVRAHAHANAEHAPMAFLTAQNLIFRRTSPTNGTPVLRVEERLFVSRTPSSDCRCGSGYRHRTDLPGQQSPTDQPFLSFAFSFAVHTSQLLLATEHTRNVVAGSTPACDVVIPARAIGSCGRRSPVNTIYCRTAQ
jgi:hypothetical protein